MSFGIRLIAITLALATLIVAWHAGQGLRTRLAATDPVPSAAPPVLTEDRTIAVFEGARDSVVFISTSDRVRNPWQRTAVDRPRGSGSGFLWDRRGQGVTKWHGLVGGDRGNVRLADGHRRDC